MRAGDTGASTFRLSTDNGQKLFAFKRRNEQSEVIVVLNFSSDQLNFRINDEQLDGVFKNCFTEGLIDFGVNKQVEIQPWGFLVLEK